MLTSAFVKVNGTPSRRTATSIIIGMGILMVGYGLLGSLLSVRAKAEKFSLNSMGLINSMSYVGFLVATPVAVRMLRRFTRTTCFVTFVSTMAGASVLYGVLVNRPSWLILRFVGGGSLGGLYVVVESWLNNLASNNTRGRLIAIYVAVVSGGIAVGQLLLTVANTNTLVPFLIAGAATAAASLAMIRVPASRSVTSSDGHISLMDVVKLVPSGAIAMVLVGMTQSAVIVMASVWATNAGLASPQVAKVTGAIMVGTVLLQVPAGVVADRMSRRLLFVFLAFGSAGVCLALVTLRPGSAASLVGFGLLGGLSTPLYGLANVYTNDWLPADKVVAAGSALIRLYAIGAMTGPLIAATAMNQFGSTGYFWALLTTNCVLAAFMTVRIIVSPDTNSTQPE